MAPKRVPIMPRAPVLQMAPLATTQRLLPTLPATCSPRPEPAILIVTTPTPMPTQALPPAAPHTEATGATITTAQGEEQVVAQHIGPRFTVVHIDQGLDLVVHVPMKIWLPSRLRVVPVHKLDFLMM